MRTRKNTWLDWAIVITLAAVAATVLTGCETFTGPKTAPCHWEPKDGTAWRTDTLVGSHGDTVIVIHEVATDSVRVCNHADVR